MLLASNDTETWSLVFDREDAAVYVERTQNHQPDSGNRQTIDDFLSSVPTESVEAEAIARLTILVSAISEPASFSIDGRQDPMTVMAWAGFRAYCLALEDDFRQCARMFGSMKRG